MKTNNKFGLEYAGPKKRSWKRKLGCWLWAFVWGLAVMLMLWGFFAVAQRVTSLTGVTALTAVEPMRRAGVSDWVAYGIVGTLVLMAIGVWAWRWVMGKPVDEMQASWDEAVSGNAIPPSEPMPIGMSSEDVAQIARAASAELELCRRMVDGALRSMSVDDYGDSLQGVSKRLGQVRVTLRELARTFDEGRVG